MANLTQLRLAAREIFDEALRAVDAGEAVHRAVRVEGSELVIAGHHRSYDLEKRHVYVIALGKAAGPMISALARILGPALTGAVIATNDVKSVEIEFAPHKVFEAGHPEPNQQSLAAAQAAFALLDRANKERALVIFLVSGGGSTMMEWPIDDAITLSDLSNANRVLVRSGASISEINAVRKRFSAVKAGRLAERASNCDQITLIVSDVPEGEHNNVASGPSIPPKGHPNFREIIQRYHLRERLPKTILRAISKGSPRPWQSPVSNFQRVVLTNEDALEAAVAAAQRRFLFVAEISRSASDEPIEEGVANLVEGLVSLSFSHGGSRVCAISGGEFLCPAKGPGIGGRNLETALRLAINCSKRRGRSPHVALCAGTDGIDGNSPAAGAIVDSTTIERAWRLGMDPYYFLDRGDAYSFFVALGDVIATGPTGTNVRDLRILLRSP